MRTDDLIDLLARGAGPVPAGEVLRRLAPAAVVAVGAAALGALLTLGPVPAGMFATPAPWIKLAYAGALWVLGAWLADRLARPVSRTGGPMGGVGLVLAAMAVLAAVSWAATPAAQRPQALWGHSWWLCPLIVATLSLPGLAGVLAVMRTLAPTRPRAAGAAAGLLAGAASATGYALACTEASAVFVALWYSVGIALSVALGTLLGPRALRW